MKKYEILIIDDEISRKESYSSIFKHDELSINFAFTKKEFLELELTNYDCFVIDITLDNWVEDGTSLQNEFCSVVRRIGLEKPIVIVSAKISDVIHWTNELQRNNLIYTIALNQITIENNKTLKAKEPNNVICNNICLNLNKFYDYSPFKKLDDEDITILHISDLQFGAKHFEEGLAKGFSNNFYRLEEKPKSIDFIVISGDITENALPSEYEKAYIWISDFCKKIFDCKNYHERIILVPGNHDVNMSISALNKWQYNFPPKSASHQEISTITMNERKSPINDFYYYATDPFKDFAYRLTKDSRWNGNNLTFVNKRFSYLGIQFIQLNTLETYQAGGSHPTFRLSDDTLDYLLDESLSLKQKNIKSFVVSHCSPHDLGYDMETDSDLKSHWQSLDSFFKANNCILFFNGHVHASLNTKKKIQLSDTVELSRSAASTLFCEPEVGEPRGFNIITIRRTNNQINKLTIQKYNLQNDGDIELGKVIERPF